MHRERVKILVKRWYLFFPVLWLGCHGTGFGQLPSPLRPATSKSGFALTGRITSPKASSFINAHVKLFGADSSLIRQTVSDSAGSFVLSDLVPGSYLIQVSHTGLATASQVVVVSDSVPTTSLSITLQSVAINLKEVSVNQKRDVIEVRGDRIILDVESNPVFAGGYVFDALGQAPCVSTDQVARTVSIDGKSGVILYQNNRQLYLPTEQVVPYLQSLPASAISRIEILTNPTAQYDAGSSGVILLYTKDSVKAGLSGELARAAGFGRYAKGKATVNLSLRAANLQGTLLYSPSFRPAYCSWQSDQRLTAYGPTIAGFAESREFNRVTNAGQTLYSGWDLTINRRTTVGAVVQASYTAVADNPTSSIVYRLTGDSAQLTKIDAVTQLRQRIGNIAGNLHLKRRLRNPASNLPVDVDVARYIDYSTSSANFRHNQSAYRPVESVVVRYPSDVNIWTAKTDLIAPLGKGEWGAF